MGHGELAAENIKRWPEVDQQAVAEQMIAAGQAFELGMYLGNFHDLDNEIAHQMIIAGQGSVIAQHVLAFSNLREQQVANWLFEHGDAQVVLEAIRSSFFVDVNQDDIARYFIQSGERRQLLDFLPYMNGLSPEVAKALLPEHADAVSMFIKAFSEIDDEIAEVLLDAKQVGSLVIKAEQISLPLRRQLAIQMFEMEDYDEIVQFLDKLPDVDENLLMDRLISLGNAFLIAQHADKFRLPAQTLAERVIIAGQGYAIAQNIEKFRDLDHAWVADRLLENQQYVVLAKNLHKFHDLDYLRILRVIMTKQFFPTVEAVPKLPLTDMERQQIADDLILVAEQLPTPDEQIRLLANEPWFLEHYNGTISEGPALEDYVQDKPKYLFEQGRFTELAGFLRIFYQSDFKLEPHEVAARVQALVARDDVQTAVDLLDLAEQEKCSVELEDEAQIRARAAEVREHHEAREIDTEEHIVAEEMADFYVDRYLHQQLWQIEQRINRPEVDLRADLSFGQRREFDEFWRAMEARDQAQLAWVREYVVVAVNSELAYQSDLLDIDGDVILLNMIDDQFESGTVKAFLRQATNEQVRQYLQQAEGRFEQSGWSADTGGPAWAKIAEAGRRAWEESPETANVVDYIFHREHNGGNIFDKEEERIETDVRVGQLLDIKRTELSPEEYLTEILTFVPEQKRDQLRARLKEGDALRDKFLKILARRGQVLEA